MDKPESERCIILARISRWKCTFCAVPVAALGIVPNLPGFGEGLTHSAFFYTTPLGVVVRLLASSALILLAMILLVGVATTFFTSAKAVWLNGDDLRWGRMGTKRIHLREIQTVSFDAALNRIRLERWDSRRAQYIPTLGLRSHEAPGPLVQKLRELIGQS